LLSFNGNKEYSAKYILHNSYIHTYEAYTVWVVGIRLDMMWKTVSLVALFAITLQFKHRLKLSQIPAKSIT